MSLIYSFNLRNRDDISDGGAQHFADTVEAIKKLSPETEVEVLTSDFNGAYESIKTVVNSSIKVFAQNRDS